MKNIMLLTMMLASYYGTAQTGFTISGKISPQLHVKKVYLAYRLENKSFQDSSFVVNNAYSFKGSLPEATNVFIVSPADEPNFRWSRDVAILYIENSDISITHLDSFSQINVQGSQSQQLNEVMKAKLKPLDEEIKKLGRQHNEYQTENKVEDAAKIMAEIKKNYTVQKNIIRNLFLENRSSPFAIQLLSVYENTGATPEEVDSLFAMLEPKARLEPTGLKLSIKLENQKKLGIGRIAPEFTQADTSGIPVSLSSFKGNYLLLDFWASWCGPCRVENPYLVKAFSKYKDKGFQVLSISLDQKNGKERWLKAIHDDQLTWTHVSDLQYWENAVAMLYGIEGIPQNYLLDPMGKIIARNLRGESLEKALEQIYKR
jgi:thiol-disulfide isomerase/thioredoxin